MEKIWDFVPTRGGGRSFAIGTFVEKNSKPVAQCSPLLFNCSQDAHLTFSKCSIAHLNGGGGHRLLLLDVFNQADLSLLNNCREINFIKIKKFTSQSKAVFKRKHSKHSTFNLISFPLKPLQIILKLVLVGIFKKIQCNGWLNKAVTFSDQPI